MHVAAPCPHLVAGNGIHVIESLDDITTFYPDYVPNQGLAGHLAQVYIRNPLLIDGGYKFNVRVYLFVASVDPPRVFFHPGYVTKAIEKFDLSDTKKRMAHVSSTAIQKKHPDFDKLRDLQKWRWERFIDELIKDGRVSSHEEFARVVEGGMKERLGMAFLACKGALCASPGQFGLYGVDFLFDDTNRFYLVEVNKAPSATSSHNQEKNALLIPPLMNELVAIMYEISAKKKAGESLEELDSQIMFQTVPL